MVNLTQPCEEHLQSLVCVDSGVKHEVLATISAVKHQCTDVDFLKAVATNMKEILSKVCHCCLQLWRPS